MSVAVFNAASMEQIRASNEKTMNAQIGTMQSMQSQYETKATTLEAEASALEVKAIAQDVIAATAMMSVTRTRTNGSSYTEMVADTAKRAAARAAATELRSQAAEKKAQAAALREQAAAIVVEIGKLLQTLTELNAYMQRLIDILQQTDLSFAQMLRAIAEETYAFTQSVTSIYNSIDVAFGFTNSLFGSIDFSPKTDVTSFMNKLKEELLWRIISIGGLKGDAMVDALIEFYGSEDDKTGVLKEYITNLPKGMSLRNSLTNFVDSPMYPSLIEIENEIYSRFPFINSYGPDRFAIRKFINELGIYGGEYYNIYGEHGDTDYNKILALRVMLGGDETKAAIIAEIAEGDYQNYGIYPAAVGEFGDFYRKIDNAKTTNMANMEPIPRAKFELDNEIFSRFEGNEAYGRDYAKGLIQQLNIFGETDPYRVYAWQEMLIDGVSRDSSLVALRGGIFKGFAEEDNTKFDAAQQTNMNAIAALPPVDPTAGQGSNYGNDFLNPSHPVVPHTGMDVPGSYPVYAAEGGEVINGQDHAKDNGYTGNVAYTAGAYYVTTKDANGDTLWYGHLKSNAVTPGNIVLPGQYIGYSGDLGAFTNDGANHLHLEKQEKEGYWGKGDTAIDPGYIYNQPPSVYDQRSNN